MVVQTLILIYAVALGISSIFAAFLWFQFRDRLLKKFFFFWLSGIAAFIAQGLNNDTNMLGLFAFSLNIVSISIIISIFFELTQLKYSIKQIILTYAIGLGGSFAMSQMGYDFKMYSLPLVASMALTLFTHSFKGLRKSNNGLDIGFAAILILNSIHFLDYPILRTRDELAVIGFSIAIIFHFIYSIYIPLYILKNLDNIRQAELESIIQGRTKELSFANEQLHLSNNELNKKNLQLDGLAKENQALVSILVHDLTNPLQVIYSSVATLGNPKRSLDFEEFAKQKYGRIVKAMGTIDEILNTIRQFHGAKLGKIDFKLDNLKLSELIDESIKLVEEKLAAKNIQVSFDPAICDNIFVRAEATWFKNQVLANLLTNAIKFSKEGSQIQIVAEKRNDKIYVTVRDYGIGIPEDLKDKIFDLNKSTSRLGTKGEKGTGLGLPIAKKYMELMEGDLHLVELSASEQGTCFQLELHNCNDNDPKVA